MTHLNVSETFGGTIQGEGRRAGWLASFLRLAGCNLTCSWCDTPYTWDWERYDRAAETHPAPVEDVAAVLDGLPGRIVVSGGEPLLQAPALAALGALLPYRTFDVETNGTRRLGATALMWDTITCSPKVIPSAGQDPVATVIHPQIMECADFKFVVADDKDLDAVAAWLDDTKVAADRVWLMPEGTTVDTLTARTPYVMDAAVRLGTNFTSRLHVYGWHDTRGH